MYSMSQITIMAEKGTKSKSESPKPTAGIVAKNLDLEMVCI